jgi:signal transduction histidine kinase
VRLSFLGSVRFRITTAAAVAVALVLGIAAVLLVTNQRVQLTAALDDSLEQRVDEIAADVVTGPVDPASFAGTNDQDRLVQLVDASGTVVAATTNVTGQPPIVDLPEEGQRFASVDRLPIEDDSFRVLARRIETERGPEVLIVAENTDDLNDSVRLLTTSLALAVPLAVLVLVAVVWWLVGRTLRPVEAIRGQVGDIGAAELDRRVPEPGTGDEIDRLALTMNAMLDRLEDGAARERRFVADTSHELRTPLTRMRTVLEVDGADRPGGDATLASLHEEVVGLQRTVEDLLVLARVDDAGGGDDLGPVDLDDIVGREVRRLRTSARVSVDMTGVSGAHLLGDRDQLGRVVRNLVDNGARHADSTVRVGCREEDGVVVLEVADDGPGIAPEDRRRVFERFARLDPARADRAGGTGLGLAIVREIVAAHGGTVAVDDDATGGARFTVRLPAD